MKSIKTYINEALKIKSGSNVFIKKKCKYIPENNNELSSIIFKLVSENPNVIDVSEIDVSKLTSLDKIFYALSVKEIKGLNYWDVSGISSMKRLFCKCNDIKEIDLTNWDVSNVESFREMFSGCMVLEDIKGIENFVFKKDDIDVAGMFAHCYKIKSLDLSKWDTRNVVWGSGVFSGCVGLEEIKGIDNWKFTKIFSLNSIFKNCSKLKNIGDLSNWSVGTNKDFSSMFENCMELESIGDLSNWDIENGNTFDQMFFGCKKLHIDMREFYEKIQNKKRAYIKHFNAHTSKKYFII